MSEEETKATTEAPEATPAATEEAAPAPASSDEPKAEDGKHVEEENTAHFEPVVSTSIPLRIFFFICPYSRTFHSPFSDRIVDDSILWIHDPSRGCLFAP